MTKHEEVILQTAKEIAADKYSAGFDMCDFKFEDEYSKEFLEELKKYCDYTFGFGGLKVRKKGKK